MNVIRASFDWSANLYETWFADWLHIPYLARTALILLVLWFVIFVIMQVGFRYVLGPLAVLFFYHVIIRVWNFIFVETIQEFIYIRYFSKDKPRFSKTYLRLTDRIKRTRLILSHLRYRGILYQGRVRKFAWRATIIGLLLTALWVPAFGLHVAYVVPTGVILDNGTSYRNEPDLEQASIPPEPDTLFTTGEIPRSEWLNPQDLAEGESIILRLNEQGTPGTRLRDVPSMGEEAVVIEVLWGEMNLVYQGVYAPGEIEGLYWLRVRTPAGTIGYVSSQLVTVEGGTL